jgi:hypothetical protein
MHRGALMMLSAMPSLFESVRGMWASRSSSRWLAPLVVFLCLTGLILILATTVEALAPFIYSIF